MFNSEFALVDILPLLGYEKVRHCGCSVEEEKLLIEGISDPDINKAIESCQALCTKGQNFSMDEIFGFNGYGVQSNKVESILPNPLDSDKLLVSMVYNNATRFPFCLLLPKVTKYLIEEEQSKKKFIVNNDLMIQSKMHSKDIKL